MAATINDLHKAYWRLVRRRAQELGSDGCSGVPDFYVLACMEHDIHYRTGRRLCGKTLTRREADARFLRSMWRWSPLGRLDPIPPVWWLVCRALGWLPRYAGAFASKRKSR